MVYQKIGNSKVNMRMFIRLISALYILHAITVIATTTTEQQKNWYQVDVIVFHYDDLPLDSITPRILPLEKKFTGNNIIALNNDEHPLNSFKNKASLAVTNDSIANDAVNESNITALATVALDREIQITAKNYVTSEDATDKISINSDFAEKVKLTDETTELVSVIDNSLIKQSTTDLDNKSIHSTIYDSHINNIDSSTKLLDDNNNHTDNKYLSTDTETPLTTDSKILSLDLEQTQQQNESQDSIIEQEDYNFYLTMPFIELPNSKYLLKDEMVKLTTDENIKILGYHCFNLPLENSSSVVLKPQEMTNFKSFSGKIDFKKTNQGRIIIKTDFYFNILATELQSLKKQQNKIADYNNKVNKKLYNYFSYEVQNNIKNSGKLMYIDSPIIGLLIKITPINLQYFEQLHDATQP